MTHLKTQIVIVLLFLSNGIFGQEFTQTLRGTAIDSDTKVPMIGANIIVLDSDPIKGASTDVNGNFIIEKVPIGRVNIQISAIGYETQTIYNIVIESAKETVLSITATESFETLEELVITAEEENGEAINKMALVSAKTVTVEETGRYAGSLNDPARMVSAFAGVSGDAEGNNDIVVRGNSPRGFLWRLEGIEIPNPNHFAEEGSSGGPVNTLNVSMLANSDFFTGAFAPEYGNAISGVFDTKFRTGNNQNGEFSFSIGVLGTDITVEGPFSKKYDGSFLFNYRYSTLDLLDATGIVDFGGVPRYQDASFKVSLPTKSMGNFTFFGLGGKSSITDEDTDEGSDKVYGNAIVKADLGVLGLKHNYIINKKMYIHSYVSASATINNVTENTLDSISNSFYEEYDHKYNENKFRISTALNNRINRHNTVKTGVIYTTMNYSMVGQSNFDNSSATPFINADGKTSMVQLYTSWKHRFRENLTLVSGLHYTQLLLNKNMAFEPRLALNWQLNRNQFLTMGVGMHSKVESVSIYLGITDEETNDNANRDLELMKSAHFVIGFGHHFNQNLILKSEVYYQYLYDVPIGTDPESSLSLLNFSGGYIDIPMVNEGTGQNYGLEITLERYYHRKFYFMLTGSIYQSKYTAMDGIERDTRYNANYASNLVIGKEFKLHSNKKNKAIAVNIKTSFLGANHYTPIDLEQSIIENKTVYDQENQFSEKGDDFFYLNLGVTYKINGKKLTQELKLDIQNLTNNQAVVGQYYNSRLQVIEPAYQLSMIPNIMYSIKF